MSRSKWAVVVAAGAVLVAVIAWLAHPSLDVEVESMRVTAGPITRRVVAAGSVQAVTTVEVGAQVSGVVQSFGADFNMLVHAGQVIARLDPSLYQAALEQAQAGLLQAQAAFGKAQADLMGFQVAEEDAQMKLTRAQSLATAQQLTAADLDAARIAALEAGDFVRSQEGQVAEARAEVDQARALVTQAQVNLDHTVIRSPIEGIVVDRTVEVGQTLAVSLQAPVLFRIALDLSTGTGAGRHRRIGCRGVARRRAGDVRSGSYPGETFAGTVHQLRLNPVAEQTLTATTVPSSTAAASTSLVATVVGYTAIIDVSNADERLRPGMTAEVVLDGARRSDAVLIPNGALAFRPPAAVLQALRETDRHMPASELGCEWRRLEDSGGVGVRRQALRRGAGSRSASPTAAGRSS